MATLVTWLVAESLGAYMLRNWLHARRAAHAHRPTLPVLAGHASLALCGLVSWCWFLVTGAAAIGWLAIGLLAVAIGFGVSTVTLWTPYPTGGPAGQQPPAPGRADGVIPDEHLAAALADDATSGKLVDELLARNLAADVSGRPAIDPRALIPAAHGILAVLTFFLGMLAAARAS